MKACITGASGGIGKEFACLLAEQGYDLILIARSAEKLQQLQDTLPTKVQTLPMDLSVPENCFQAYAALQDEPVDLLINNAGYGLFGPFHETDIDTELNMLDLNIKAVHILTKLFLQDFIERKQGAILNVASSAAFLPGPLLSGYYASKAYVLRLTQAIYEEVRRMGLGKQIYIGALCPGPVKTGFDERAGVRFSLKGLDSRTVAAYALRKMEQGKPVIVPGLTMKLAHGFERFVPDRQLLKIAYHMQQKKR